MKFFDYNAVKVWFTITDIYIQLAGGETASLPIANFPILALATSSQLNEVTIVNGYALQWEKLGEDLCVAGFFKKEQSGTATTQNANVKI